MRPETHDLSWAELDRLADYTADALSPGEADQVARLVANDPRWSTALRALRAAEGSVQANLAAAMAAPTRMPDDVAAQIDAALQRLTPHGATVISLDAARAKRRRAMTAGFAAAAATVVAVLGGLVINTTYMRDSSSPMSAPGGQAGRDAPEAAPSVATVAPPALGSEDYAMADRARVVASGTDYRRETLAQSAALAPEPAPTIDSKGGQTTFFSAGEAPDGLLRLNAPAALESCLRAVNTQRPGVPVVVDYARFEGQPALVIVVRQENTPNTTLTIVVVGPDCGRSGTDERAAVTAG
jgi:hypothetical protein